MKNQKAHYRIAIVNFFIMYPLYAFLSFILLNFEYSWEMPSHEWRYIFLSSFGFNIAWNLGLLYKAKYKNLKLHKNMEKDMEKMKKFLSLKKVKKIKSLDSISIYKAKNKYSLIPIKFYISSEEKSYSINAPRFIIDKITKI